ncbi:MAG: glucose-1-phosphate adenylyltransferase subunit GlgD [Oscillospiraceae bacterium]|nr:glucose-1-phosphate adenylyltransferase subunit GlgD [Oscillospiraceae bacterium]
MGVKNSVLGLIFASLHDSTVVELTKQRTMGSIMFGGRYRLIDFPLSNMVNSGITEVGVITKSNYGSLLDHLGTGREWDLSRKKGGLHLLPPFSQNIGDGVYRGRLEALNNVWNYVQHSSAEYVILADCDYVCNINFEDVLKQHIETGADITAVYGKFRYTEESGACVDVLEMDAEKRIKSVLIDPQIAGECNICLDMYVMRKDLLAKLVKDAVSRNKYSLIRDCLQAKVDELKLMGYEFGGYFSRIDSVKSYFEANMALLQPENRAALFQPNAPIYTKIGDNGPVKYGLDAKVSNSLIADGCIIEGTVENCILFRGVKVGKGSIVRDCILMQGTTIGNNCALTAVITDKNVEATEGRVLTGSDSYPLYIGKNAKI